MLRTTPAATTITDLKSSTPGLCSHTSVPSAHPVYLPSHAPTSMGSLSALLSTAISTVYHKLSPILAASPFFAGFCPSCDANPASHPLVVDQVTLRCCCPPRACTCSEPDANADSRPSPSSCPYAACSSSGGSPTSQLPWPVDTATSTSLYIIPLRLVTVWDKIGCVGSAIRPVDGA